VAVQDLDPNVPVLVMKLGHYPLHHGVMGAIRSLGRAGVPVYAVHEDRLAPAGMSKYLTGRFIWPTMVDAPQELLQGMTSMAGTIGRRAILLPADDRAAVFVAEHAPRLREHFCFPDQPAGLPRRLTDKLELFRICRSLGVASPDVADPASRGDVVEFSRRVLFPVMLKLAQASIRLESSALLTSGIPPTMIADSPGELLSLYDRAERLHAGPVLLQEYIPDGEDWIVHGYCNERSECLAGFTGVKLRSYPPRTGGTTLGICRSNPGLLDQARLLFHRLGYRGILDMDWRLDHRDGQYKLLDFNPRVGAQFRLFVNRHGVDVVRAMHLDLTGRPVPGDAPPDGRTFMAEQFDVLSALAYRRQGELTLGAWWSSVRQARDLELGWLDRDDLLPAGWMAARSLFRAVVKGLRLDSTPRTGSIRPPRYYPGRLARSQRLA
jgi:predicted ATP-grasp superfamily ATP-dependent carboligase